MILFVAAIGLGLWVSEARTNVSDYDDMRTVLEVIAVVKRNYVEHVSVLDLLRGYVKHGTINGMLSVLGDPYTRYLPPHAFQQMRLDSQGEFEGIGIVVGLREGQLTIVGPIEGTPGFRAGLRGGDKILQVDDRSTKNMSLDEAVSLMRGPAGTEVKLIIEKGNTGEIVEVAINRANVKVKSVTKIEMLGDGVGYIRLASFTEKSAEELQTAMDELKARGMKGLVLDLRGNPGGLMDTAVKVADLFIDEGPLLHVVPRPDVDEPVTFYATSEGTERDLPLVVMVDQYSASASEIVSGAFKDTGRALVLGVQTFGKGLVQQVVPLRSGDAVTVTMARYQTAGKHDIHEVGVAPDVVVELPEGVDPPYFAIAEQSVEDVDKLVNLDEDPQLRAAKALLTD
ncbi:MAG: S41 family peptidase [Firmicutes bacterium]|nr:S41 family peptidase [Bacillota bacterium]